MSEEKLDNLPTADGNDSTPEKMEVKEVETTDVNDTSAKVDEVVEEDKVEVASTENSEEAKVEEEKTVEESDAENKTDSDVISETDSDVETETEENTSVEVEITLKDYSVMAAEDLLLELEYLVKTFPVQRIYFHTGQVRESFNLLMNKDKKEKEEAFLAEGGNIIDFRYENYTKNQFNSLYNTYRKSREVFQKNIEDQQDVNFKFRQDLIEELKNLINKEEKMSETFKEFREIQDKWSNAGMVPKAKSSDLWRNYHHHVENFYDYLRLNNEMRDLDFKHNLEEKIKIVERAINLQMEPSIKVAFDELQELHRIWKEESGPVAKEFRDEIWQQFSDATKVIHDKRHENLKELRVEWANHLKEKEGICEEIEVIAKDTDNSHSSWQNKIKKVDALKEKFQKVGRVSKNHNNEIWQQFKDATRAFNKGKNDFYKSLKKDQLVNLEKKQKLVEIAEANKESEDWKGTITLMKKIQNDWKKIGHVPRQQSDEIWGKFRGACNHFFDRMTDNKKGQDKELNVNYDNKKELLIEVDAITELPSDKKESVSLLKEFINKWKALGSVPRDKKAIENHFNNAIDKLFDKLDLGKNETAFIKFQNKIDSLVASDEMKTIYHERDVIRKKMEEIRKEMTQLDNNLGFFSVSKNNPLVKDVHRKIDLHKENLKLWKMKLDHLRKI